MLNFFPPHSLRSHFNFPLFLPNSFLLLPVFFLTPPRSFARSRAPSHRLKNGKETSIRRLRHPWLKTSTLLRNAHNDISREGTESHIQRKLERDHLGNNTIGLYYPSPSLEWVQSHRAVFGQSIIAYSLCEWTDIRQSYSFEIHWFSQLAR